MAYNIKFTHEKEKISMRLILDKILAVALLAGLLTTGCEWTASDGDSTWSGKYDNMNFSGTYRIISVSVSGDSTTPSVGSVNNVVLGTIVNATGFSGTLKPSLVPGSVTVTVTEGGGVRTWTDTASDGSLISDLPSMYPIPGSVNYNTGAISLNFTQPATQSGAVSGTVKASYGYNYSLTILNGATIAHITVDQNGNNLRMLIGGINLELNGKFTRINEVDSVDGQIRGYNAGFEVSGKSSNGTKVTFVGTLNSSGNWDLLPPLDIPELQSSDKTRYLDGSLVYEGIYYDVRAETRGSSINTTTSAPSTGTQSGEGKAGAVP